MSNVRPPALLELFDLARAQVRRETPGRHVMNDPGVYGYIAAFEAVLSRGVGAIEGSFDLLENLGPGVNWAHAGDDEQHRWFRVLTATIGLYLRGGVFILATHELLVSLLVDGVALELPPRSGRSTALCDALVRLCREFPALLADPREGAAFILGELILLGARGGDDAEVVARCAELERIVGECEEYYLPGDDWRPNPWFAKTNVCPWGWWSATELHPVWIGLVAEHFPEAPEAARIIKMRLLADGARWADKRRRLS